MLQSAPIGLCELVTVGFLISSGVGSIWCGDLKLSKMRSSCVVVLLIGWLILASSTMANCEGEHCGDSQLSSAETDCLMKTTAVIYREKGDTNKPSGQWLAFQKYLKFGSSAKPEIQELISKGTPAGRLYGAILLKQIDAKTADAALAKMKDDQTAVNYFRGCSAESTTAGALALRILKGEELVQVKSKP